MKRRLYAAGLVLGGLFVAGCQSVQAPPTAYKIWEEPAFIAQKKAVDEVWLGLREVKTNIAQPFILVDLVDIAIQNNWQTRQAWAAAKEAEARRRQSQNAYYPQVYVQGAVTREDSVGSALGYSFKDVNYGPQANLQWLLLDCGGRAATVEQQSQLTLAANYSFNNAFQTVLLNVEKAYYSLQSARAAVEAAQATVEDTKKNLELAQSRLTNGLGTSLDVLQTQASYDEAQYALEGAKGNLKRAESDLAKAVGWPADTPLVAAKPTREVPLELTDENVNELIEEGLARRPDIASSRADLQAQVAAVRVARSAMWPTFNAGSTLQYDWYDYISDDTGLSKNTHNYTGYLSLEWSIFDGFNNYYGWRAAQDNLEKKLASLAQAEVDASAAIWNAFYDYKTAWQKFRFSQAYLQSSEEAYQLAGQSYENGLKTIVDLLKAQSDLADARSKFVDSQKGVFIAYVQLAYEVGRLGVDSHGEGNWR